MAVFGPDNKGGRPAGAKNKFARQVWEDLLKVWADPAVQRNTHTVRVVADAADLTMTIENVPSGDNPRTGRITAQSAISALRRLTAPLVVGS